MNDTSVWPLLNSLVECLRSEFLAVAGAEEPVPMPDYIGLMPGQLVIADYIGVGHCATAFVQLVSTYPSSRLPDPDYEGRCETPLAHSIRVGVLRCAPLPHLVAGRVVLPTELENFEAVRLQLADMRIMRRAIKCCLGAGRDYILSDYAPQGPEGDSVGGTWTFAVSEDF